MKSKFNEAVTLFQDGELNKAKDICLEVLKIEPNNFDILHLLGVIAFQSKNYLKSAQIIGKAIQINSNNSEVYNNHAIALIYLQQFNTALESLNKAIEINPNYAEAYNNRGNVLIKIGKANAALASLNKAIEINPNYAQAYNNRGNVLRELNQLEEALKNCDQAIKINPNYAEGYNNKGIILKKLSQFTLALASLNKAIEINPNYAQAYNNRGNVLKKLNQLEAAVESYSKGIQINSDSGFVLSTLIHTKLMLCDWKSYEKDLEKLKNKILSGLKVSTAFSILTIYDSLELQKKAAEIFIKEKFPVINFFGSIFKREPNKKIRIGYYSADFHNHPVSYHLVYLLELHDRSKFEIFGFSFGPNKNDEMQKRISVAFDKFYDVRLKSDNDIIKLSRDFKIDIAIDLMGFTKNNRFKIFTGKCAPIQVNYLGYPGTVGTNCIDYIIADNILIPKKAQKNYYEKIIYLPNSYMVNDSTRKISDKIFKREEFGLPKNDFVFYCFNSYYKLTPNIFDIWMRLLKNVKNSVFWLPQGNLVLIKNLKNEASKRHIDPNRLIFAKRMSSIADHLSRHRMADLFIDTFPYGAHSTCADALWAGVPVITLAGESFASKVSASLLNAIGLSKLITNTEKEYEDLAVELSTNPARLKEIRKKLENYRITKPLFNTKLFVKNIESAYSAIHERYLLNKKPENIEIK